MGTSSRSVTPWAGAVLAALAVVAPTSAQQWEATLVDPSPSVGGANAFGWAVDIDGGTAAVGAPRSGGDDQGLVRVYRKQGSSWVSEAELDGHSPFVAHERYVGSALALNGNRLLVGAWGSSDGESFEPGWLGGHAMIYLRTAAGWDAEATLRPDGLQAHDAFGRAVALASGLAVVAAPGDDTAGPQAGSVRVYRRTGSQWNEDALLLPPLAGEIGFGAAVAVAGDTLAIGAPLAAVAAPASGAIFVYRHSGTAWQLEATLAAGSGQHDDRLGAALALDGDLLVAGAPRAEAGESPNAGAVLVFRRGAGGWAEEARLVAPLPSGFDNLGAALDVQGDLLLAGCAEDDDAGGAAGAAHLFHRAGGRWLHQAVLLAPDASQHAQLGRDVALDGDLGLLGAPWHDASTGPFAGRAYVFHGLAGRAP